jgi:hypothetical protein
MKTFRNIHSTKRDYECTNVVACTAEQAPNENWVEADDSILAPLDMLCIERGVTYYGYL